MHALWNHLNRHHNDVIDKIAACGPETIRFKGYRELLLMYVRIHEALFKASAILGRLGCMARARLALAAAVALARLRSCCRPTADKSHHPLNIALKYLL
jgi:hypothetical protein